MIGYPPVQSVSAATSTTGGSLTLTWPSATGAGRLLILVVAFSGGSGTSILTPIGWTLVSGHPINNGTNVGVAIFILENAASQSSVTVSFGSTPVIAAAAAEYSGVALSAAYDVGASSTGNSTSPASGTTPTTAQADELLVAITAGVLTGAAVTQTSPTNSFASRQTIQGGTGGGGTRVDIMLSDRLPGVTGAFGVSTTVLIPYQWAGAIIALKAGTSGTTYTEAPVVKFGFKPSQVDAAILADTPQDKLGLKPSQAEQFILASGGIQYADSPQAKIGFKPSVSGLIVGMEAVQAKLGLKPLETDIQRSPGDLGIFYYDAPRVRIGFKPSVVDLAVLSDTPRSKLGLKPSQVDLGILVAVPVSAKIGLRPSVQDGKVVSEAAQAKIGFKPSAVGVGIFRESAQSKIGFKPSLTSQQINADTPRAKIGFTPSEMDLSIGVGAPQAKIGFKPSAGNVIIGAEVPQAKIGFKPSVVGLLVGRDIPSAKIGFKPSASDSRAYQDFVRAILGPKASGVGVSTGVEVPRGKIGFKPGAADLLTGVGVTNLITAVRFNSRAALPDITQFPESLTSPVFASDDDESNLPYLAIIARAPHAVDAAVNDAQQIIPIDFVLVRALHADGVIDAWQQARDELIVLQQALRRDYRQRGQANDTNLAATPIEVYNAYQQFFYDGQQIAVAVMVLTMEFSVITSRLP